MCTWEAELSCHVLLSCHVPAMVIASYYMMGTRWWDLFMVLDDCTKTYLKLLYVSQGRTPLSRSGKRWTLQSDTGEAMIDSDGGGTSWGSLLFYNAVEKKNRHLLAEPKEPELLVTAEIKMASIEKRKEPEESISRASFISLRFVDGHVSSMQRQLQRFFLQPAVGKFFSARVAPRRTDTHLLQSKNFLCFPVRKKQHSDLICIFSKQIDISRSICCSFWALII